MVASSDQVINLMWDIQEMRMRLAQYELNQLYARVAEFDPMYHTEHQQNSFMVEVGQQMEDLSNTISDIANRKDMLRGRWNQTTEHQIAHEDQCILMSELPPEEPNVHGKQCMALELMSEIDRPQDEVSELREILEEECQEECNLIGAVTTVCSAKEDHFKHCIHSCKACDEILEYLAAAEDFKALPEESVPYLDSSKPVKGGSFKDKKEEVAPKLDLKPLPAHIQFPFLEKGETFPIIVSANPYSIELKQVLDVGEDANSSLMLEHHTARALVDVDKGELDLRVSDESSIISKSELMKFHEDEGSTSLGERPSLMDDHFGKEAIHIRGRPLIDYPP